MKLAILTCGMLPIPAVQGGAVENLIDFYLEYNNHKKLHDITVFSPWNAKVEIHPALVSEVNHYVYIDTTSLKARIIRKIYQYIHFSSDYYNYFIEYYFEKVYRRLKKANYDYIILENCPGYAYKLSQRGYKNLILHLHNELLHSNSKYHDIIFNSLTKVITVSEYIKERVASISPSNKIQTVFNGIDIPRFSTVESTSVSRQSIGFSENDFVIVYSGRINKEKGVSELIDAMLLLRDFPHIKLMILGSSFFNNVTDKDTFVNSLKSKSEEIKDKIVFTGFIPYDEVPNYLHIADIAVLPSMWEEPFGLTLVEAMAAGLPLITTQSGGIPEICEGVATIVDRKDIVNNLKNAITDLYNHPDKCQQMAIASQKRAQLFSKETFAKNFFDILKNP